ncbi:BnaC08g15200D [Brassica napus]|uniref:BnaC08g15200D protein n=1 Tax=Brassica napus TaxID=3708 RepID=A0A078GXP3_BRANA|nr:BnaC08g15200D [Brassica napus]
MEDPTQSRRSQPNRGGFLSRPGPDLGHREIIELPCRPEIADV